MVGLSVINSQKLNESRRRYFVTITVVAAIVAIYEVLYLIAIPVAYIQYTLGFALLIAVIYIAWRYGLRPAVVTAILSNAYLLYAFSGPGRNIVPLDDILRGEWLLGLMFFGPAVLIGYLSDRINLLIQRERQARSEAENDRLQLIKILEQMPVGVIIARPPNAELVFSNQHLDQILGHEVERYAGLDEYPKKVLVDGNGDPLPEAEWPISRVIKNQESLVNEEYFYRVDKHTRLTLQVKGTPIFNSAGEMTSGVVIIDDITSEKEMVQRKDDFLSMVSHELKTPITSLTMYTQLLMKQFSQNHAYNPLNELQKIDEQTKKLNRIINNMLELAIIQQDKHPYQFVQLDINPLIIDVVQELKHAYPRREVQLNLTSRLQVLADKSRLTQVISNLIGNAIKYSPEETSVLVQTEDKNNSVLLSIQDFGIGIAVKDRKKIFERFYQETQKSGKIYPGLGIGLYFSSEIIKQHSGKIWVESKKEMGSTFYISLPHVE